MSNEEKNVWADEEFDNVDLTDKRLDGRLRSICASLSASPESPVSQACGDWAEAKATYYFFANDRVDPEDIMTAHRQNTEGDTSMDLFASKLRRKADGKG